MKRILLFTALLCALLLVAGLLAACNEAITTGDTADSSDQEGTADTTSGGTDVTAAPSSDSKKLKELTPLIGEKDFKGQALEMMKLIIRDFYNVRKNQVLNGEGGQTTLWAAGSFFEAITSVYELYPEDETIRAVYIGLLDRGIPQYKVLYRDNGYSGAAINGVRPYYYNASAGNSGDYYYDDDLWIAIQYMKAYELLGKEKYLSQAQEILEFVWLGWGLNSNKSLGNGGIPWKVGTGPLTCSNAPAAYAFVRFSMLTENEDLSKEYLERSQTVYDWVNKYLRSGNLYIDGPGNNWSGAYNNGLMLAASSLLYQVTGKDTYLNSANRIARSAFSNNMEKKSDSYKFKNDNDNPWMSAWLIKAYVEYYKIDPKRLTTFLDAAANVMAFALDHRLDDGYFGEKLNSANNTKHSTDCVNLGGGVSLLTALTGWAEEFGSNYQAK